MYLRLGEPIYMGFLKKGHNSNRRGRPRTSWEQNLEENLKKFHAGTNYETAAKKRKGWKTITEEAPSHLGL